MVQRIALALVLLLLASGCSLNQARLALAPLADGYNAANVTLTAEETAELAACNAPPVKPQDSPACVEAVVGRWAKTKAALSGLHVAIEAARLALRVEEAKAEAGSPMDLAAFNTLIAAALTAANALKEAMAPTVSR